MQAIRAQIAQQGLNYSLIWNSQQSEFEGTIALRNYLSLIVRLCTLLTQVRQKQTIQSA